MGKNKKIRCCRILNDEIVFKPQGIPMSELEIVDLEVDEIEVLRLCDYEQKSQIQAAEIMQISRGTIQRLLNSGRKKILEALLYQQGLRLKNKFLDYIENQEMNEMGEKILKIAFSTSDEVTIEEHFGGCSKFVIYSVENGKVLKKEVLDAPEHVSGAYPKFIMGENVKTVITGGMGPKAMNILTGNGVEVILGASGEIEKVLEVYLKGELKSNGEACSHHHEHHHGEGHNCSHN